MNTQKVKRHQNSDTKTRQQRTTTKLSLGTVCNELLTPTSPSVSEVLQNIQLVVQFAS